MVEINGRLVTGCSINEAARILDVAKSTIKRGINDGRFKTVWMETSPYSPQDRYMIDMEEVKAYKKKGAFKLSAEERKARDEAQKKYFISVPMNGRKDEDVLCEIASITKTYFPSKCTSGWVSSNAPKGLPHPELWYLGKSIMKMAECTDVIFAPGWDKARGCITERIVYDFYFKNLMDDMLGDVLKGENDAITLKNAKSKKKKVTKK